MTAHQSPMENKKDFVVIVNTSTLVNTSNMIRKICMLQLLHWFDFNATDWSISYVMCRFRFTLNIQQLYW